MDKYNIKSKINYRNLLEENTVMQKGNQKTKEVIIIIISLTQIEVIIENREMSNINI
jgi:hypothetical protein